MRLTILKKLKKLKKLLPASIQNQLRNASRSARFGNLDRAQIFDKIYAENYWGVDEKGLPSSGTGSHVDQVVRPYVEKVLAFLEELGHPSVVDLGCGDFNVGSFLHKKTSHYLACDISERIIAINAERFLSDSLEFKVLDLVDDPLPKADVCLLRQVLQHLSNDDILGFINKLHATRPFKYLVLTEHVARSSTDRLNRDKPTGPGTRLEQRGGLDIEWAPFNLQFAERRELVSVRQDSGNIEADIVTVLYKF